MIDDEQPKLKQRVVIDPPDLQVLVREAGSFSAITREQWAKFDSDMRKWRAMNGSPAGAADFDAESA